ncbi:hypothetical protein D3C72_272100 [compost metagenome]
MFGDVLAEVTGVPEPPPAAKAESALRAAGDALGGVANHAGKALDDAINGLCALLGGGSWLNSGLTFDEETNAKAKPLFISTAANLKAVSQDLREAMRIVVRMVVERFGAEVAQNMQPYVVRVIADVRDGKASLENENERGTVRGDGPQALDEVVAGEGGGTESGRGLGVDPANARQVGRGTGVGTDAAGLPAVRGGRGGAERADPAETGARGGTGAVGARGARKAGGRVPKNDEAGARDRRDG